jgi:Tfp pilus assembly protein PilF
MMKRTITFAVLASITGCAGQQNKDLEQSRAEAVWEEKSPYGFHRSVSYALLRTKQAARASLHIRTLLALKPDAAEPHYLMGWANLDLGLLPQARKELERALEIEDKYAAAHAMMGVLQDKAGEHRKAEKSHRKAIALQPKNALYYNNLGFGLYLQGRHPEAIAAYSAALDRNPALRRVHNNLGFSYAKLGRFERAHKHFKLAGTPAEADNNLGFAYEGRGQLEQAYGSYLKALRADPELEAARDNLTRVCKRLGRPLPDLVASNKATIDGSDQAAVDAAAASRSAR